MTRLMQYQSLSSVLDRLEKTKTADGAWARYQERQGSLDSFAELRTLMEKAGRDFSTLEITSMVDSRLLSAADIRTYQELGVTGLYVVAPGPEPQSVVKVMREFPKKIQDAVGG